MPRALLREVFFNGLIECFVTLQGAPAYGRGAMGKRYFCDYCDRSFQDNLHNRKKHLNGLQHLKAKKVWYDMFRGACSQAWRRAPEACTLTFPSVRQRPLQGQSWMDCFSYVYFYFMYVSVCLHVCRYTTCVLGAKSEEGVKCSVAGVREVGNHNMGAAK